MCLLALPNPEFSAIRRHMYTMYVGEYVSCVHVCACKYWLVCVRRSLVSTRMAACLHGTLRLRFLSGVVVLRVT